VRYVTSHRHSDGHWNTQSHVLACDDISYDVIGHFETFVADFRAILERLDAPPAVLAIAAQVTNPTTELPTAAAYDSELAAVVYDYYREDFERFDYYRDSWLMPAPRP
jgi:hypothetical protein